MKAVQVILNPHVKSCGDCTFFLVASNMQISVGSAICQSVNQRGISMEAEDDVLIFCKKRIVIHLREAMWMLALGLELHQIDDIDHTDFQIGQMLARMETAAKISSVGVSPQQPITTSGSASWSLLAHCQMPIPSVQCTTAASIVSH